MPFPRYRARAAAAAAPATPRGAAAAAPRGGHAHAAAVYSVQFQVGSTYGHVTTALSKQVGRAWVANSNLYRFIWGSRCVGALWFFRFLTMKVIPGPTNWRGIGVDLRFCFCCCVLMLRRTSLAAAAAAC